MGAGPSYYSVALNTAEFDELELDTVTARVDYKLAPALTLTSITSASATIIIIVDFDLTILL